MQASLDFLLRAAPFRHRIAPAPAGLALAGLLAAPATATLVIDSGDPFDPDDDLLLDVAASVGTGANTSYLIVDFGATGGASYAFAWRWDAGTDARGFTLLEAITAGTDLDYTFGGEDGVGFGIFIDNFVLPGANAAGDPANFWAYWNAEAADVDPGVAWSFASGGASDRLLSDGSIDGWYNGFDDTEPAVPTVPVPAPGVLALLGAAGLFVGRRRG